MGVQDQKTWRQVSGTRKENFWHFGIHARASLSPLAYIITPHVLLSDDGQNIWTDKQRLHKARRSLCKNWWNPEWRDRILATMHWLANENEKIQILVGNNLSLDVSTFPLIFNSPVSYNEPDKEQTFYEDTPDDDDEFENELGEYEEDV